MIERDRLVVTRAKDGRTESVPLTSIREINVRQEMADIFSTLITRDGGGRIRVPSRHFRGLGQFDDRRAEYGAFVRALLEATSNASPATRFTAGSSLLYALGWILVAMAALLGGGFVFSAITRGMPPLRVLAALPISLLVGVGFLRQGRARPVDPARPPSDLVPQ